MKANRRTKASLVLAIAGLGYLLSVSQRSTLGAAAIVATERFHITGEQLSLLAVAQLGVYALLQIPVGVLLDRFGSRHLLVFGAAVMAIGQFVVAQAPDFQVAALGRLAVGFGDAFTFVSLIRLINGWTEGSSAARAQQLLGNLGQLGQVVSAFPFAWLLHLAGWQSAFVAWSGLSLVACALIWVLVTDERYEHARRGSQVTLRESARQLIINLRSHSVRMAFWTHFVIQSPGTVMVLLWGMPFLVSAEGLERPSAASLLSMFVLVGIAFGAIYGWICAKHPRWRIALVVALYAATNGYWLYVLSINGPATFGQLFGLFFVLGISGPGSMLAFDFSRVSVPRTRLGSANGFINIGGFLASFTMMFLIGFLLDWYHAGHRATPLYSIAGFRQALPVQFLVLAVGIIMFIVEARLARRTENEARE